jgi:hypothetical protein
MMIKEFLARVTDAVVQPETQASVTTGAGLAYYFTLNNIIGALTVVLLVGQLGLVILKYRDRMKAKKHGTKE